MIGFVLMENEKINFKKEVKNMDDLKHCPFCGGNAVVRRVPNTDITPWYVRCDNPDCAMWVATCHRDTEEEAIKLWNKRAT